MGNVWRNTNAHKSFWFHLFFLLRHTLWNSAFKPKKNGSVKWSVYICMHCIAGVFCFQAFYCLFGCECFKQRNETHFTKHSDTNTKTFYSVCAGDAVRINDGSRESSVFLRRSLSLSLFTLLKILDDSDACVQCVCVHLKKLALRWMVHHVLYCVRQCFISMVLTAIHSLCLAHTHTHSLSRSILLNLFTLHWPQANHMNLNTKWFWNENHNIIREIIPYVTYWNIDIWPVSLRLRCWN